MSRTLKGTGIVGLSLIALVLSAGMAEALEVVQVRGFSQLRRPTHHSSLETSLSAAERSTTMPLLPEHHTRLQRPWGVELYATKRNH